MNKNNDFIYDAVSRLETSTGLTIEVDSKRKEYDASLTINEKRFNVIAKSSIRDSNIGIILSPYINNPVNNNSTIIFIAKYISKSSAFTLKENGLNYLDTSGNAYVRMDEIFICIEGQKTEKYDKDQSRAFQEAGLKLILLLLSKKESLGYSYRELSEKTDISIGSISNIINELEELNFVLRTKEKRVIKNKKELIERWVIGYNEVLKPRILRKKMKFLKPVLFDEIKNEADGKTVFWGGEPAAAILTNNLRPQQFIIYSNLELSSLAKQFKLTPNPQGDVEICELFWKLDTSEITAPPLIVYADLISSGFERNIEMAKIISQNEL
jgi:hypothetical protein